MSFLRTVALILFFGPLSAMLVEPFFETLFDNLGWDTEDFAGPVMTFVSEYSNELFALMGFGAGVWAHYFSQRFAPQDLPRLKAVRQASIKPPPRRAPPKQDTASRASTAMAVINSDGHHLIPKPDEFFGLSCKRTEDGHDLSAYFLTRNRSKNDLWIEISEPRLFKLSNDIKGGGGGGGSNPYRATTIQRTFAGSLTCYNDISGLSGIAVASISFGEENDEFTTKLILEVDFVIESQIDKAGAQGDLAHSITANRTRYEVIEG